MTDTATTPTAKTLERAATVAAPSAKKPERVTIKPRRMDFVFDETLPRYWVDDPFLTHFLNSLSLMFPGGEQFFVDSVRAFRDRIDDPELRREINGFIGQEAMHSKEHRAFNAWLDTLGYDATAIEKMIEESLDELRKRSHEQQLATTCALEHITAILGDALLRHDDIRARFDEKLLPLWLWHAVEETEHKGVAFDVYQQVCGSYPRRVAALITETLGLFVGAALAEHEFLEKDGLHRDPRVWARGLYALWGPKGYLSRAAPAWLTYFRPDFHPWQHDNSDLVDRWKARLGTKA